MTKEKVGTSDWAWRFPLFSSPDLCAGIAKLGVLRAPDAEVYFHRSFQDFIRAGNLSYRRTKVVLSPQLGSWALHIPLSGPATPRSEIDIGFFA